MSDTVTQPEGWIWYGDRFKQVVLTMDDAIRESIAKWEWILANYLWVHENRGSYEPGYNAVHGGGCALCWHCSLLGRDAYAKRNPPPPGRELWIDTWGPRLRCEFCPLNDGTHEKWCCREYLDVYHFVWNQYMCDGEEEKLRAAIEKMLSALREVQGGKDRRPAKEVS